MDSSLAAHPASWEDFGKACGLFSCVWIGVFLLMTIGGAKGDTRSNTVTCCLSLVHGTTTTFLSGKQVLARFPSAMDGRNTRDEERIMQFSMAYFLLDTLHCLYYSLDTLFVLHHIQTFSYMLWSGILGRGAFSVMMLMSSGEVTSPVQNVWTLAKDNKAHSPRAALVYDAISPFFTYIFTLVRVFVGPPIVYLVVSGLYGSPNLPASAQLGWSFMAVLGCVGSWLWVVKLWKGHLKRASKMAKKAQ